MVNIKVGKYAEKEIAENPARELFAMIKWASKKKIIWPYEIFSVKIGISRQGWSKEWGEGSVLINVIPVDKEFTHWVGGPLPSDQEETGFPQIQLKFFPDSESSLLGKVTLGVNSFFRHFEDKEEREFTKINAVIKNLKKAGIEIEFQDSYGFKKYGNYKINPEIAERSTAFYNREASERIVEQMFHNERRIEKKREVIRGEEKKVKEIIEENKKLKFKYESIEH